jgi:23S rRNA (adenine2503-C2)-methyltransferase
MKSDLKNLTLAELEEILNSWSQPHYRARQIFAWVYKKRIEDFDFMSDLSQDLRERLKKTFNIGKLRPLKQDVSEDGTRKFLFELEDGNRIETVFIPVGPRRTLCLSTQVGCRFSCRFCLSGLGGFIRNLSPAEIIGQLLQTGDLLGLRATHLVFMGIGEPLDNYENVFKAIRILNSPSGLNIGARRMTISTCGIIPGIERMRKENLQVELAVSLHAADDKTRNRLMPAINRRYPIEELMQAIRKYIKYTKRQVTFEYILISRQNSSIQDARDLVRLLKGLNCKVNLIPYNSAQEFPFKPPAKLEILIFRRFLSHRGINVTIRTPRGKDIQAACGQLRLRDVKE